MVSDNRIAQRYAKAVMDLAIERGTLDQVDKDMELFQTVNEENRQFFAVMHNPIIRAHKKLSILKAIFEGKVSDVMILLFEILARRSREEVLYSISVAFREQFNIYKNIQEVYVTSTVTLPDPLKEELRAALSQKTGKTIKIEEEIDESLIGGMVIRISDTQLDNSIKSQLQKIKQDFRS
ncbi:ATP synthase F1 subunit delta [Microscilla marina]|uniref:ATP synthase subunit delta n=1 Tax=Microscilla marina ATCC 23134 TaxID=313606 RepID=A1ZKB4_MICM2|nr:ATP synthase F1 subunit delta [Microscilla marina]EAY29140.1 ATP synthase F1, delta subunit [Microscilla marina ATCC 23134]